MKDLTVAATWDGDVPVLTVDYSADQMFLPRSAQTLSERLVTVYRDHISGKSAPKSCIIVIAADTAGSPLVRALFELYKVVKADDGQLYCVSYPDAYIDSLTSLGLTVLPGFYLCTSMTEALAKVKALVI